MEAEKSAKEKEQKRREKIMKVVAVLFVVVVACTSGYSVVFAEGSSKADSGEVICFSIDDARKVLTNEMQCDITEEQLKNCEELNLNKSEIISQYEEKIKLLEEKNIKCDETVNELKRTIDEEREVIKSIKSSGISEYLKILGFFGLGVLVGILL
jgi:dTDP-4-amino-4,6-dideoxygalactose transaminase